MRNNEVVIIINAAANGGKARGKWERIKKEVLAHFKGKVTIQEYVPPFDLKAYLKGCARAGIRQFIAGGGDGTLNYTANILYELERGKFLEDYVLGALGLGSSNDFFKPRSRSFHDIPVRIDLEKARRSDRGRVCITNAQKEITQRVFLVNAGLGVTSNANYLFNNPDPLIGFLKPRATSLAILLTALQTIFRHTNKTIDLLVHGSVSRVAMSNLSITLIPFISGSFRYKEHRETEGVFDLYLCRDMGRMELLRTLVALSRGAFRAGKHRMITTARTVAIRSGEDIPLEVDGEIFMGSAFQFEIDHHAIRLAI